MVTRRTERMVQRGLLMAGAGVLAVLTVGLTFSTYRVYTKMVEVRAERVHAEDERDALAVRNAELGAALGALSTDRGVESEIRSRYPLVKTGEVEFVIVDKEKAVVDSATSTRESIWDTVRGWFSW